jgi:hypothetical protein
MLLYFRCQPYQNYQKWVFSSAERAKIIELMIIEKFLNEALDEKCLI